MAAQDPSLLNRPRLEATENLLSGLRALGVDPHWEGITNDEFFAAKERLAKARKDNASRVS